MEPIILPLIDLNRCGGCGRCVEFCPTHAVAIVGGKARIVRPEDCTFCDVCENSCPSGAIGRPFVVQFAQPERRSA